MLMVFSAGLFEVGRKTLVSATSCWPLEVRRRAGLLKCDCKTCETVPFLLPAKFKICKKGRKMLRATVRGMIQNCVPGLFIGLGMLAATPACGFIISCGSDRESDVEKGNENFDFQQ
jgi:hypothetical protein